MYPVQITEPVDMPAILQSIEKKFIEEALRQAEGIKSRAARLLGIHRTTFVAKMKLHGMAVNKPYPRSV